MAEIWAVQCKVLERGPKGYEVEFLHDGSKGLLHPVLRDIPEGTMITCVITGRSDELAGYTEDDALIPVVRELEVVETQTTQKAAEPKEDLPSRPKTDDFDVHIYHLFRYADLKESIVGEAKDERIPLEDLLLERRLIGQDDHRSCSYGRMLTEDRILTLDEFLDAFEDCRGSFQAFRTTLQSRGFLKTYDD